MQSNAGIKSQLDHDGLLYARDERLWFTETSQGTLTSRFITILSWLSPLLRLLRETKFHLLSLKKKYIYKKKKVHVPNLLELSWHQSQNSFLFVLFWLCAPLLKFLPVCIFTGILLERRTSCNNVIRECTFQNQQVIN